MDENGFRFDSYEDTFRVDSYEDTINQRFEQGMSRHGSSLRERYDSYVEVMRSMGKREIKSFDEWIGFGD